MAESKIQCASSVVEIPLTLNSGIIVGGSAKCYKSGRLCFISLNNVTFSSSGFNQVLITNAPKPIQQVSFNHPSGANNTETENIILNSAYITTNSSNIMFNINTGTNNTRHWFNCVYITSE